MEIRWDDDDPMEHDPCFMWGYPGFDIQGRCKGCGGDFSAQLAIADERYARESKMVPRDEEVLEHLAFPVAGLFD